MKKWYKESYFDANAWLLDNFDKLNLSIQETLFLIFVNHSNKHRKAITNEVLMQKFTLNQKQIDILLANLVDKHYLTIKTNSKGIVFDIEGIFDFDPSNYDVANNNTLYDELGDIFGKPLTSTELQKINDLLDKYGQDAFLQAVRVADGNRKLKLSYIEGILRNENK